MVLQLKRELISFLHDKKYPFFLYNRVVFNKKYFLYWEEHIYGNLLCEIKTSIQ